MSWAAGPTSISLEEVLRDDPHVLRRISYRISIYPRPLYLRLLRRDCACETCSPAMDRYHRMWTHVGFSEDMYTVEQGYVNLRIESDQGHSEGIWSLAGAIT